jgi:hypothetical protein
LWCLDRYSRGATKGLPHGGMMERLARDVLQKYPTLYPRLFRPEDHPEGAKAAINHVHHVWRSLYPEAIDSEGHPPFVYWEKTDGSLRKVGGGYFTHAYLDSPDCEYELHPVRPLQLA